MHVIPSNIPKAAVEYQYTDFINALWRQNLAVLGGIFAFCFYRKNEWGAFVREGLFIQRSTVCYDSLIKTVFLAERVIMRGHKVCFHGSDR